ncbi:MAG: hypothetical protein AAGC85_06775, partial [Bacteroidota bacterium]
MRIQSIHTVLLLFLCSFVILCSCKRDGTDIFRNEKGIVVREYSFKNGKMHGPYKLYFEDGRLCQIRYYKHGILDSLWLVFTKDSILVNRIRLKNGLKHGLTEDFYANGNWSRTSEWRNGSRQGE